MMMGQTECLADRTVIGACDANIVKHCTHLFWQGGVIRSSIDQVRHRKCQGLMFDRKNQLYFDLDEAKNIFKNAGPGHFGLHCSHEIRCTQRIDQLEHYRTNARVVSRAW